MQVKSVKNWSRSAITAVLLSALAVAGCGVDAAPDTPDDELADPASQQEIQAPGLGPATAGSEAGTAAQIVPESALAPAGSGSLGGTTNACRTTCRDVVHPELCLFIPFPFCLIPQHECVTLCDVP